MKPENFKHVKKLWKTYEINRWTNIVESRECFDEDTPRLSQLEWDTLTFGAPTAESLTQLCNTLWDRHKIAAIWFIKASKNDGLITIVIC